MATGPYVQYAVFVDRFIRGAHSGSLSLINIIDQVTVAGPDPDEMPPFSLAPFSFVVGLWAGQTKGRYGLLLRPEAPSGVQHEPVHIAVVQFPNSGAEGQDAIARVPFEVTEEGAYWFDLLLQRGGDQGDQLLTRIPLRVVYQPTGGHQL